MWTERVKGYRCCNWFQIKWLFKKLTINPNLNCNTHGGLGFQPVTLVLSKREKKHIFVWQFELFPQIYLISLSLSLSLSLQVLLNLLYFYGMCGVLKECLLQRYFSKVLHTTLALIFFSDFGKNYILNLLLQELRCGLHGAESDIIQSCRRVRILMHNRDMPVYLSCLGKIELV